MMKKNSERNAAIRFMKKLFILFIPFIALLAVYFLDVPGRPFHGPEEL